MEYIIGIFLLIIVIVVGGLIYKRRLYDSVDYYEGWKLDISNRDVVTELAKVKDLQLAGETQEAFERWRKEWDVIVNGDLARIEELLFDAEVAIDRYKFKLSKQYINDLEENLVIIERDIERILEEVQQLLKIDEENRKEINRLEPLLKEAQKALLKNRYQYHGAISRFEKEIAEIEELFTQFETNIAEGNYKDGASTVSEIDKRLEQYTSDLAEFPQLYKVCKTELPAQLEELKRGLNEMLAEGYRIEQLELDKEINDLQTRLEKLLIIIEDEGTKQLTDFIPEVESRIQEMYDTLETEALARNFVEAKSDNYEKLLTEFTEEFKDTKTEVASLKETYYFDNNDLEKYLTLEKLIDQLKEQRIELLTMMEEEKSTYSELRTELEAGFNQLEKLQAEHKMFLEQINTLRKDEVEAREELNAIENEIGIVQRKLRQSNLPGIPQVIWELLDDAANKNQLVINALAEQPLDIEQVQKTLAEAKSAVNVTLERANLILEQAYLTEQVIQYANRYRSNQPILHANLLEAERLFRNAEYELALEKAATAIEEVEPNALKKIEKYQEKSYALSQRE